MREARHPFVVPVEAPAGLVCKEGTVWCGPPDGAGPPVVRPSGTHWLLPSGPLPSTALWLPQRPQACSGGHSLPPCGHVFSVTPCLSGPSSSGALCSSSHLCSQPLVSSRAHCGNNSQIRGHQAVGQPLSQSTRRISVPSPDSLASFGMFQTEATVCPL